jgi:methionyl-tRNA synthetase
VSFVPCNHEYLNYRGGKFSKSRARTVDVPYFLSKYEPDALGFCLTAVSPETRDTEFAWEDFVERNNRVLSASEGNELMATARLSSSRSLGLPWRGWPTAC